MFLGFHLEITEEEEVKRRVENSCGEIFDLDSLDKNIVLYFDSKGSVNTRETDDAKFAWVDTGKVVARTGKPIFVSMIKEFGTNRFTGYFVGDFRTLYKGLVRVFPTLGSKETEKLIERKVMKKLGYSEDAVDVFVDEEDRHNTTKSMTSFSVEKSNGLTGKTTFTPVTQQIYDNLLINNWKSVKGLDVFIKICGCRIADFIKEEKTQYYRKNSKDDIILNTGLIDRFNSDVIVLYRHYAIDDSYRAETVVSSKRILIDYGFEKKDTDIDSIEPITFLDADDVIDEISVDDFDISTGALSHVVETNRERLAKFTEGWADEIIAERIKAAVTLGVRMYKRDKSYFKPFYSAKGCGVSWMMPLYLSNSRQDAPEVVLVFRKIGEFYEVKTAFEYTDDVVDRTTALALYGSSWM